MHRNGGPSVPPLSIPALSAAAATDGTGSQSARVVPLPPLGGTPRAATGRTATSNLHAAGSFTPARPMEDLKAAFGPATATIPTPPHTQRVSTTLPRGTDRMNGTGTGTGGGPIAPLIAETFSLLRRELQLVYKAHDLPLPPTLTPTAGGRDGAAPTPELMMERTRAFTEAFGHLATHFKDYGPLLAAFHKEWTALAGLTHELLRERAPLLLQKRYAADLGEEAVARRSHAYEVQAQAAAAQGRSAAAQIKALQAQVAHLKAEKFELSDRVQTLMAAVEQGNHTVKLLTQTVIEDQNQQSVLSRTVAKLQEDNTHMRAYSVSLEDRVKADQVIREEMILRFAHVRKTLHTYNLELSEVSGVVSVLDPSKAAGAVTATPAGQHGNVSRRATLVGGSEVDPETYRQNTTLAAQRERRWTASLHVAARDTKTGVDHNGDVTAAPPALDSASAFLIRDALHVGGVEVPQGNEIVDVTQGMSIDRGELDHVLLGPQTVTNAPARAALASEPTSNTADAALPLDATPGAASPSRRAFSSFSPASRFAVSASLRRPSAAFAHGNDGGFSGVPQMSPEMQRRLMLDRESVQQARATVDALRFAAACSGETATEQLQEALVRCLKMMRTGREEVLKLRRKNRAMERRILKLTAQLATAALHARSGRLPGSASLAGSVTTAPTTNNDQPGGATIQPPPEDPFSELRGNDPAAVVASVNAALAVRGGEKAPSNLGGVIGKDQRATANLIAAGDAMRRLISGSRSGPQQSAAATNGRRPTVVSFTGNGKGDETQPAASSATLAESALLNGSIDESRPLTPRPQWHRLQEVVPRFQLSNQMATSEEVFDSLLHTLRLSASDELIAAQRRVLGNRIVEWLNADRVTGGVVGVAKNKVSGGAAPATAPQPTHGGPEAITTNAPAASAPATGSSPNLSASIDIRSLETTLAVASKAFVGRGTGPQVPVYLRLSGRLRNRMLTKADVELLLRRFWAARRALRSTQQRGAEERMQQGLVSLASDADVLAETQTVGGGIFLSRKRLKANAGIDEFFHAWLLETTGSPKIANEVAYSMLDVCERYVTDPDFGSFLRVLQGAVSETCFLHQLYTVDQFRRVLVALDDDKSGRLPRNAVHRALRQISPAKRFGDGLRLRFSLLPFTEENPEDGLAVVRYEELFEEDANGNQTAFVERLRHQHLDEAMEFLVELEEAVRARADGAEAASPEDAVEELQKHLEALRQHEEATRRKLQQRKLKQQRGDASGLADSDSDDTTSTDTDGGSVPTYVLMADGSLVDPVGTIYYADGTAPRQSAATAADMLRDPLFANAAGDRFITLADVFLAIRRCDPALSPASIVNFIAAGLDWRAWAPRFPTREHVKASCGPAAATADFALGQQDQVSSELVAPRRVYVPCEAILARMRAAGFLRRATPPADDELLLIEEELDDMEALDHRESEEDAQQRRMYDVDSFFE